MNEHVRKEDILACALRNPIGAYERAGLPPGTLRRVGSVLQALCPLHQEETASFTLYPKDGGWRCFGCGKGGDLIDFYMAVRSMPKPEFSRACDELGSLLGVAASADTTARPRPAPTPEPNPEPVLPPIPAEVVDALHARLMNDPAKVGWLQRKRGLTLAIIEEANLGVGRGPIWREERFCIPIMDPQDLSVWRDIRGYRPSPGAGVAKMMPWEKGRGTPTLFPWPWVCRENTLVWTEGELDCLNLIALGIPACTGTCGVDGALSKLPIPDLTGKTIIVLGDDDDAGRRLNAGLPPRLYAAGARAVRALSWEEVVGDG